MPIRPISFKDDDRDKKLLKAVDGAYNKSAFVKECIAFYLDNKDTKFNVAAKDHIDSSIGSIDDWDF